MSPNNSGRCHCLGTRSLKWFAKPSNLCLVNGVDEIGFDTSYCTRSKEYITLGLIQEKFTATLQPDPGGKRSAFRLADQPCDGHVRALERLRLCFAVC